MASSTLFTRLRRYPGIYAQLRTCARVTELFAVGAAVAMREGGFDRALVLTVADRRLTALDTDVLEDPASDRLRRRVLASPVPLQRGTHEAELVRRADVASRTNAKHSLLADQLGLDHYAYGPVVDDASTLALLVVDRGDDEVEEEDRVWVELFATVLAVALNDIITRARVAEISAELRHFTASATALVRETSSGRLVLPSAGGAGVSLTRIGVGAEPEDIASVFSERELRVAELLVEGKSNRQIAEDLVVSPETVKTHVKHILRKLGAHNRAEAVGLFLRMQDPRRS